jgi:dTDP-glucose 4,6-dehydratase
MGVLARLFRLIDLNLPVPLIGNGSNRYQMISVFDCVSAVTCAVAKGIPNEEYNLGSKDPPEVSELLKQLIVKVGSRSRLMKTPASPVKALLGTLDYLGLTLLYKEQYAIADLNYLVDISKTEEQLGWHPQYRDEDMLCQAYREYERLRSPAAKEKQSHV